RARARRSPSPQTSSPPTTTTGACSSRSRRAAAEVDLGHIGEVDDAALCRDDLAELAVELGALLRRSRRDVADRGDAIGDAVGTEPLNKREAPLLDRPEEPALSELGRRPAGGRPVRRGERLDQFTDLLLERPLPVAGVPDQRNRASWTQNSME